MKKSAAGAHFSTVEEYIAAQPENVQAALRRVRGAIRKAVPGGEELISYKMPAYRMPGGPMLWFAGWKQHYSLYPATERVRDALKEDLARYKVSKGTIRFPLAEPVPVKVIGSIARLRATEAGKPRLRRGPSSGGSWPLLPSSSSPGRPSPAS